MPIVATSTMTRGALNSRRITTSSMTAPKSVPTISDADGGEPERHVVLDDQQREEAGADEAHVADREVDDPGRPVDEHDAHREQTDHQARDEAVEDELRR